MNGISQESKNLRQTFFKISKRISANQHEFDYLLPDYHEVLRLLDSSDGLADYNRAKLIINKLDLFFDMYDLFDEFCEGE